MCQNTKLKPFVTNQINTINVKKKTLKHLLYNFQRFFGEMIHYLLKPIFSIRIFYIFINKNSNKVTVSLTTK